MQYLHSRYDHYRHYANQVEQGLLYCDIPKNQYTILYSWKIQGILDKNRHSHISHEIYDSRPSIFLASYFLTYFLPSDKLLGYALYLFRERYEFIKRYLFEILRQPQQEADRFEFLSCRFEKSIPLDLRRVRSIDIEYETDCFIFEFLSDSILVLSGKAFREYEDRKEKIIGNLIHGKSVMESHGKK